MKRNKKIEFKFHLTFFNTTPEKLLKEQEHKVYLQKYANNGLERNKFYLVNNGLSLTVTISSFKKIKETYYGIFLIKGMNPKLSLTGKVVDTPHLRMIGRSIILKITSPKSSKKILNLFNPIKKAA